ncbi:unnamed protein product [Citrullus colocynthis]|uniref:Cytochrome P450 n=1 Tax=Citrullus colocynthis TaxID=252529 RepID=A0ABP0XV79_9ROSI
MLTIFFGFVTLTIVYYIYWTNKWKDSKFNGVLPPGTMGLPLIGETIQLSRPSYSLDLHPFIQTKVKRYGPIFKTCLAGRPVVVSADAEFNHYIMLQEGKAVEMWYLDAFSKFFGLDTEWLKALGLIHKYIRSITLNHYGVESLRERFLPRIEESVQETLHYWATQPSVEVKDSAAAVEHEAIRKARVDPDGPITWEEYKSMTFTHNVISETLRLGSVTPSLLRKTTKEIQIKGYTIPEGWTIMLVIASRHRNPEVYKNPDTFNPWRWKELDSITIQKNFMPFGGGLRHCAGAEYTKVYLCTFLHILFTKYRWTKLKGGKIARALILKFVDGLHVNFTPKE